MRGVLLYYYHIVCLSIKHSLAYLMGSFRSEGDEVPEGVWVFTMGGGIPFLCMDETWEEHWVSNEEYLEGAIR